MIQVGMQMTSTNPFRLNIDALQYLTIIATRHKYNNKEYCIISTDLQPDSVLPLERKKW